MRIAYLDCFSGMSGDMFLGALVDAGVSPELLEQTVEALDIGARLEISRVNRSGITATKVDVFVGDEKELPREEFWATANHSHDHEHAHHHDAVVDAQESGVSTATPHKHDHEHNHVHGRGLNEIRGIIQKAGISERAKKTAIRIFEKLGAAEAKIHNIAD